LQVINGSGLGLTAALKASGNGIEITDTTGGTGDLVIADNSSTTAAELGIAGTFSTAVASVKRRKSPASVDRRKHTPLHIQRRRWRHAWQIQNHQFPGRIG